MSLDVVFQEAIQEHSRCEVADEPVVVRKTRPVKASNGVEDKTGLIVGGAFNSVFFCSKGSGDGEGVKYIKCACLFFKVQWTYKLVDRQGSLSVG